MALPKCPKCEKTLFQSTLVEPLKSNYKLQFIHCAACGCVVGTQEYYNIGAVLQTLAKKLGVSLGLR